MLLIHPSLIGTLTGGALTLLGLPWKVLPGKGSAEEKTSVLVAPIAHSADALAERGRFGAVALLADGPVDDDAECRLYEAGVDAVVPVRSVPLLRARLASLVRLAGTSAAAQGTDLWRPGRLARDPADDDVPPNLTRLARIAYRLLRSARGGFITTKDILIAMETPDAAPINAVAVMARLRRELGPVGRRRIKTVYGRGYQLLP